jgi:tryptophan-rich sensory protein
LWVVAACGIRFFSINKVAGMLFIPYQVWVTLATALTAGKSTADYKPNQN